MQITLNDKTAVVTGSTQGIGLAIAKGLAGAGAEVVVNGLSDDEVVAGIAAIEAAVPAAKARGVVADLSSAEGCQKLVDEAPRCDILVNNAAVFESVDFFGVPDETWQKYLDLNLMSGVRLSRAYLPGMGERGWGRVVFISSECAISTPPDMLPYATTKTALLGLSRGLAKCMAGTGVTVNAVLPGPTLSEGVISMLEGAGISIEGQGTDVVAMLRPSSITKRFASTTEVANMVVYTCSELSSATSGAALRADGGVADIPT